MNKFLLFNSPIYRNPIDEDEQYIPPLGLGYIATYLDNYGINVELYDTVKQRINPEGIVALIKEHTPNFAGFNIFTQNYDIVKDIVESINNKCDIFIGGQAVKYMYEDILSWKTNNKIIVIIGEAELITPLIVLDKCEQAPFIKYDNRVVYIVNKRSQYFPEDISSLCLKREYLKDEILTNHYGDKEAYIVSSRGCIYNCAFCAGAKSLNSEIIPRTRSEASIIKEIEEILVLYPETKSIRFLDDLFLRNKASIDIAINIFMRFPKLYWRAMIHVNSLFNSLNKLKELKSTGCKELFMGIESGSEKVRKKINKTGSIEQILVVAEEILTCGIDLKGYFIYGFPKETKEDFELTYKLAFKIKDISRNTDGNFRTSVFQFRPYKGTQLYNEIVNEKGQVSDIQRNNNISLFKGRTQFNFTSGNYSAESDSILGEYIVRTQKLAEEY